MEQEVSDIILFFGRFHPMILHLPIGFLVMAFILEMISRYSKTSRYEPAIGFILLLGCLSAALAALLGYMLSFSGSYNEQMLWIHQWAGISVTVMATGAYVLKRWHEKRPSVKIDRAYLLVISAMIFALALTGHYGGSITHGSNYLTEYMPNSLRTVVGLPTKKGPIEITDLEEAVVYRDIVHPIFDSTCIACHNESKLEGGLQMHTRELLVKGGDNGPIFVEGSVEESEMLRRIHLPERHDEHMPPDGKRQLTDDQVELLEWWVRTGASFENKVAEVEVDDDVQSILNTLVDPQANMSEAEILLASSIPAAGENVLRELRQQGIVIRPISAKTNWLQAVIPAVHSGDSLITELQKVADQLTWLDMGGSATSDEEMLAIGEFIHLTRLSLDNTNVTDEGLSYLDWLSNLAYLNLYGTQVSDEGIQQLSGLSNLQSLYLWRTRVTKQGAIQLAEAMPELEVNLGFTNNEQM